MSKFAKVREPTSYSAPPYSTPLSPESIVYKRVPTSFKTSEDNLMTGHTCPRGHFPFAFTKIVELIAAVDDGSVIEVIVMSSTNKSR